MNIIVNNFSKLNFEKINDELISKKFLLEINNKYFSYKNNNIVIEDVELKNFLIDIERLLKGKYYEPKRVIFKDKTISIVLYPLVYGNRTIMDLQVFLKNEKDIVVSDYTLTLEREDIISMYVYLCQILDKEDRFNLPEDYKYMFLFVRYLDIDSIKQFCYISDDENIRIGDYVLVDRAGNPSVAIVENIEFHTKEDSPFNFEKTKEIIRRLDRKELKNSNENEELEEKEEEESYVTIEEFKSLKKDFEALKDILKQKDNKLSIKELIRQILRDNIYLEVFYNKEFNIFIEKVGDMIYLSKYKSSVFSKKELKGICKNSIYINTYRDSNIKVIYDMAVKLCNENNIEYVDDYIVGDNYIGNIKLEKVLDLKENKEKEDSFYSYVCQKNYNELLIYCRDIELSENIIKLYKDNVGKIIKEKGYVECSKKIGGLEKNTRFYIFSNHIADLSAFEESTDFGICVANEGSLYKIIEVGEKDNKNYVILLHIDQETGYFLNNIKTNIDDKLIDICKKRMEKEIKDVPLEELTEEWYKRLYFPIGIDKEGRIVIE